MSLILFSIDKHAFLALYYSSPYSAADFLAAPRANHEQQWRQLRQGNVALSIKQGRIYRIARISQGIYSILDIFIFTLRPCLSE